MGKQRQGNHQASIFYKDKSGNLVLGDDVINVWKQHFQKLLNGEKSQVDLTETQIVNTYGAKLPSNKKVREIIKQPKNNKIPGMDNIMGENV